MTSKLNIRRTLVAKHALQARAWAADPAITGAILAAVATVFTCFVGCA